jgi:hypothetical protein
VREGERHTDIVLAVPLEADVDIIVVNDHAKELIEKTRAFTLSQTTDVLNVVALR